MSDAPSFSWRSILEARPVLQAGLLWKVGSGEKVNVWNDSWIPNTPAHALRKPNNCLISQVSELIDPVTKSWDIGTLNAMFSQEVVDSILCILLSSRCSRDRITWKLDKKGFFSVKTGYWIARDIVLGDVLSSSSNGDPYGHLWKALWNAKVPGKVSICLWRACHNLLPTRVKLSTKGYEGQMKCVLCSHPFETIGHVMCECPTAKEILAAPPFQTQVPVSHSFSFKEWMLEQAISLSSGVFARLLMIIWSLWRNRNDKFWNNKEKAAPVLVSMSMAWYEEFLKANEATSESSQQISKHFRYWYPPPDSCVKLNVDGSFISSSNYGGVGGLIRNKLGQFVAGFSYRKDHVSSPFHVELLAIKDGIELLQAMEVSTAIIHSDCLLAVNAINSDDEDLSPLGNLIEDIKDLLKFLPQVSLQHAPRTTNFVAHRLASYSFDSNVHLEWFSYAPDFILDALRYDCNRI